MCIVQSIGIIIVAWKGSTYHSQYSSLVTPTIRRKSYRYDIFIELDIDLSSFEFLQYSRL